MIAKQAEIEKRDKTPSPSEGDCVYLDHNATTPVRPEVVDAMIPFLRETYGNPNSVHSVGQKARKAVEEAREEVARLIGADADEIVFTSCGSESDVLALTGAAQNVFNRSSGKKNRIITTVIEHEAMHGACRCLAARGFKIEKIGVDENALVSLDAFKNALADDTAVASVMFANNEVGTIQPIAEIARMCAKAGVLFHSDAVQAVGKVPIDVHALGLDLLSLSGHKINAPKGIGALYVKKGAVLTPVITGHQEKNRRGGTENVASIIGLGVAARLIREEFDAHLKKLSCLRDKLEAGVGALPGAHRTSRAENRLPGTSHFCFEGVDGHHLVVALDLEGVCVSSGPACSGGMTELSHVLKAMNVAPELGRGALRVTLGWSSSDADIERFLALLPRTLDKLRTSQ